MIEDTSTPISSPTTSISTSHSASPSPSPTTAKPKRQVGFDTDRRARRVLELGLQRQGRRRAKTPDNVKNVCPV